MLFFFRTFPYWFPLVFTQSIFSLAVESFSFVFPVLSPTCVSSGLAPGTRPPKEDASSTRVRPNSPFGRLRFLESVPVGLFKKCLFRSPRLFPFPIGILLVSGTCLLVMFWSGFLFLIPRGFGKTPFFPPQVSLFPHTVVVATLFLEFL